MKSINGKVVLVTGASSGLGRELVHQLLEKGALVAATFRKQEEVDFYNGKHAAQGMGVLVDVTDDMAVKTGVAQVLAHFGRIDIVANCAGAGTVGAVEEMTDREARRVFDLNFFGGLNIIRAVTPAMRKQRSGHIIQFSAIGGFIGYPGMGVYSAAKGATDILGEALAGELAPFNIATTVLTIGVFETQFAGRSLAYVEQKIDDYEGTPVGKFRVAIGGLQGKQPNVPGKGALAIINLMEADNPPVHAALGADAMGGMRAKMAKVEQELVQWQGNATSTERSINGI
ncbi:SDR family NAD(P)-dependent oxidoreductase [Pseudomonas salomonii]|uniref:SDR family NAD(P)-dependent oxidoreductase n=1 Tax=Pseudomonas salomonii TaxID=191391 RepID=A0A7Y8KM00_9PSED|nr:MULTISPECIES: SDR family NAD(P)-dependent oxidoreductase [Pseudomonas]NWF07374.1 SDR family NAD(P)-dependent oxidoreductase [Pseudomonas salomonii]CRM72269.1 3-oxoacyl-[acyl-carrier-protein] reductase FabG [Pseudomonas sp. 58 R 3]